MKRLLLPLLLLISTFTGFAQVLSWNPYFVTESTTTFTITVDGSKGNQELFFYTPVTDIYVHIGVITSASTNQSDWKYSKFNWGVADAASRATSLGNSKWSYTITGGFRNYFGITNPAEKIEKIAILFRNGNG
ncbi:MAG: hypothetical protein ABIN48_00710, partial [Ginsengibacter sp.]